MLVAPEPLEEAGTLLGDWEGAAEGEAAGVEELVEEEATL